MSENNAKKLRTVEGRVVSNKMDKTVTVLVERQVQHALYGKYIRRSTKLHAHDADNACQMGDKVRVAWSEDEQRVVFEKIVKDTGDDSPDDQAKAGIQEPSEVAEDKTDVPKPSVGDEVQSKDDKSAE